MVELVDVELVEVVEGRDVVRLDVELVDAPAPALCFWYQVAADARLRPYAEPISAQLCPAARRRMTSPRS